MNLIEQAIGVLERDGWCQHQLKDEDTGERCLIGALARAAELSQVDTCGDNWVAVLQAVRDQVKEETVVGSYDPIQWNDQPGRTVDEVTELMRYAAKRLDA